MWAFYMQPAAAAEKTILESSIPIYNLYTKFGIYRKGVAVDKELFSEPPFSETISVPLLVDDGKKTQSSVVLCVDSAHYHNLLHFAAFYLSAPLFVNMIDPKTLCVLEPK